MPGVSRRREIPVRRVSGVRRIWYALLRASLLATLCIAGSAALATAQVGIPTGYKCFQGKDLKINPIEPRSVPLVDDQLSETVHFKPKVKFYCEPADVEGGTEAVPPVPLVCYTVKAEEFAEPQPKVNVLSQFEISQFQMKKAKLLCTFVLP